MRITQGPHHCVNDKNNALTALNETRILLEAVSNKRFQTPFDNFVWTSGLCIAEFVSYMPK